MTVIFEGGYTLPGADQPLTQTRIAHAGNWLSGGTASAGGTAAGFFEDAPLNTLTYEFWKPTAATQAWAYDHGTNASLNYCCIGAHTLGTSAATIRSQYWDGAVWTNTCPATLITDDSPIFIIHEPVTGSRGRVVIDSYTAAPKIGVIKFGLALQFPQAIFGGHAPIEWARKTVSRTNESETGEFLGRTVQRTYRETSYSWTHLSATWIAANWGLAQRSIESEPFFLAWRPLTYEGVTFGRVEESPIPENMGIKNYMQVSMTVKARGYD